MRASIEALTGYPQAVERLRIHLTCLFDPRKEAAFPPLLEKVRASLKWR
jgi:hypothetical protein